MMDKFDTGQIFEWDTGNTGKNFRTHTVTDEECEEVFFDEQKKYSKTRFIPAVKPAICSSERQCADDFYL